MIRAELARLLTVRGTYGAALAAIGLGVLLAVSALAPENDIRELSAFAAYPAAIAGLACAHLLGEEFVEPGVSPTFVVRPGRTAVLATKALAAALYGLVLGALVAAAMLITAALGSRTSTWPSSTTCSASSWPVRSSRRPSPSRAPAPPH